MCAFKGTVRLWDLTTYKLLDTVQIALPPQTPWEAAEAAAAAAAAAARSNGGSGGGGEGGEGGGGGGAAATAAAGGGEVQGGEGAAQPQKWKSAKQKHALLRTVLSSPTNGHVATITSQATKIELFNPAEAALEPLAVLNVDAVISSIAFLPNGMCKRCKLTMSHRMRPSR